MRAMMTIGAGLGQLPQALAGDREGVIDRWLEAAAARCWQLRTAADQLVQLRARAQVALDALATSIAFAPDFALGSSAYREPVQLFSFLAGWMAGVKFPVGAALALCHGLGDALGRDPERVYQHLAVVVTEAYALGLAETAHARHRAIIEKSQVVCSLGEGIVGLFLVGDPDHEALDDAVGRLMMLAVMRDARGIILEVSSLQNGDVALSTALRFLGEHRQALGQRPVFVSGLATPFAAGLASGGKLRIRCFEGLEQSLAALRAGER